MNTKKKNSREWTAFIPLRMGSKRLPKKNIRLFLKKPLYTYTIDQALKSGATKIIISTDIPEILDKKFDNDLITVIKRPAYLSSDKTEMSEVIYHTLNTLDLNNHLIVLLQATSPLRTINSIKSALAIFFRNNFDMVLSVTKTDSEILKFGTIKSKRFVPISKPSYCFQNTQNLPSIFKPNGAIFIFNSKKFLKKKSFPTTKIGVLEMNSDESVDIDNINDFALCESTYRKIKNDYEN